MLKLAQFLTVNGELIWINPSSVEVVQQSIQDKNKTFVLTANGKGTWVAGSPLDVVKELQKV